ncbi:hypothetical protein BKA62DRAFT_660706 [Auriculariales sp. MPI-PUGE-AT-0066]|nr:hypothetical protein BKA62DRAFT_660706 [Auriculariales sp. MPI-PUGE-AT-0066]
MSQTSNMIDLPTEVVEQFVDLLDDDRESLLACSQVARSWHIRSMAHIFRVLRIVHGDAQHWSRWFSSSDEQDEEQMEEAFIRVTVSEFRDDLLVNFAHLVRFVEHLQISSRFGDDGNRNDQNARTEFFSSSAFRLPDGHNVKRVTITGDSFLLPSTGRDGVSLQQFANTFAQVSMLSIGHIASSTFKEISRLLSCFPGVTRLELSSVRSVSSEDEDDSHRSWLAPRFVQPCAIRITSGDFNISHMMLWISLAARAISDVTLHVVVPSRDRHPSNDFIEVLKSTPAITRNLVTVLKLELKWDRIRFVVPGINSLFPNIEYLRLDCRDTGWHWNSDIDLTRTLSATFWVPGLDGEVSVTPRRSKLRVLVFVLGCEFLPSQEPSWESLPITLSTDQWKDLRLCLVRLTCGKTIPSNTKRQMRSSLDRVCKNTKAGFCIDDSREKEEYPGEAQNFIQLRRHRD